MRVWMTGLVVTAALALPASALADSQSIASAPQLPFGQQVFGNTNAGLPTDCWTVSGARVCDVWRSFWTVPVVFGDSVTIDWQADNSGIARTTVSLYPIGTNDYNLDQADAVQDSQPNTSGRNEIQVTASQTGLMPLVVRSLSQTRPFVGVPYNLTAYVKHGVQVFLPRMRSVVHNGTVTATVRTPEGSPITTPGLTVDVLARLGKHWRTVGSAPVSNSAAAVALHLPSRLARHRHHRVAIRARAHGNDYVSAQTGSQRVRVR